MIYLGFKFAPIPGWDVVMPIIPPSNYVKQEAKDKYIAKRKAQLAAGDAAYDRLVGTVVQVAIVEAAKGKIVDSTLVEGDAIADLFDHLMDKSAKGVTIVGYKINRALKLMALMAALREGSKGATPVAHFKWIDEAYNKYHGFVDPVSLLFGTTDLDLNAVAMRCGVKVNADDPRNLVEFAQVMLRNVDLGK